MRLQHKTAIITGGGTGIGRAIALEFAAQGANVALCGRRIEPLENVLSEIEGGNEKAFICKTDITSISDISHFVQEVLARFGTIDILVNNAGISLGGNILTTTEESFDTVLQVDLKGIFRMSKAVIPHMVSQSEGKIINIASIAALLAFPASYSYSAAKGAIISITRQMALDFAKNNINVNAIAPGIIETDMTKKYLEIAKNEVLDKTPLGRVGRPEDVAKLALYLACSDSDFMTGQTVVIDGGWTIK